MDRLEYYLNKANEALIKTSRTANGVLDVSASKTKKNYMAIDDGRKAQILSINNFNKAIQYAFKHKDDEFLDKDQFKEFLLMIASIVNEGIVNNDNLIRCGEDTNKYNYCLIKDIKQIMDQYCRKIIGLFDDPIKAAAFSEYYINIKGHFFTDGCGKTSKIMAIYCLMRQDFDVPVFDNKKMFEVANQCLSYAFTVEDQKEFEDIFYPYYQSLFFDKVCCIASQVVAGINYRYLCLDKNQNLKIVTIYQNLKNQRTITNISDIDYSYRFKEKENVCGGYGISAKELEDKNADAFKKLTDSKAQPIALVKGQVGSDDDLVYFVRENNELYFTTLRQASQVKEIKTNYEKWYEGDDYYWGLEPADLCYEIEKIIPQGSVLDIGCGEGKDIVYFAKKGYQASAFDITESGIRKTKRLAQKENVEVDCFVMDINEMNIDKQFDIIYSTGTIQYLKDDKKAEFFNKVKEMTNVGGINWFNVFVDKEEVPLPPDWDKTEKLWQPNEIYQYYQDWEIIKQEEKIFDCNSSGVKHKHCMDYIIAQKK